ncbi:MAG: pyridoxamine 5'-phosphate oxidase family protein, partial [Vulcanimicrobiota bacterium]
DSLHLYFSTGLNSRKVKDIKKNPAVHYTAMKSNDGTMSPYIQFQGRAVLHTDQETKDRVWVEEFANYFKGREDPNYAVIELIPERIEYMGMDPENWEPDIWEPGM